MRQNYNGPIPEGPGIKLQMLQVDPSVEMMLWDRLGPKVRHFLNERSRFRATASGVFHAARLRGIDPVAYDDYIATMLAREDAQLKGWADA